MNTEPKYPEVVVQLSGEDGNIFAIIGRIRRAMKAAGVGQEAVDEFSRAVTSAHSYDEALAICMRWVDVR